MSIGIDSSNSSIITGLNNKVDLDLNNSDINDKLDKKLDKLGGEVTGPFVFNGIRIPFKIKTEFGKEEVLEDEQYFYGFRTIDKNNQLINIIGQQINNDKSTKYVLQCYKNAIGVSDYVEISCGYDKDGNWVTYTPTPDINDNTTKIANTSYVVSKLKEKIMPIGSTYIQFSGSPDPATLFDGSWTNISNNFSGKFLRIEGGNAASFGNNQNNGLPNITGNINVLIAYENASANGAFKETWRNMNGQLGNPGTTMGGYSFVMDASRSSSIYQDDITEVRPENITVRIWKRTA